MKKWLLALMICLSFASLTAGGFLLNSAINASYSTGTEQEQQEDDNTKSQATVDLSLYPLTSGYNSTTISTSTWLSSFTVQQRANSSSSWTTVSLSYSNPSHHFFITSGYQIRFKAVCKSGYMAYRVTYNSSGVNPSSDGYIYYSNFTSTRTYYFYPAAAKTLSINLNGGSGYFGCDYNEFDQTTAYIDDEIYISGSGTIQTYNGYVYYRSLSKTGASGLNYWSTSGCSTTSFNFRNFIYRLSVSSSSASCTAYWTMQTYTITYDYNGGTVGSATSTDQFVYKDSAYNSYTTPPSPTRAGYSLNGWSVNLATTISGAPTSATRWESSALSVTPGHYYTLAAMWYNGTKYVSLRTRGFVVNGSDVKTGKYQVESGIYSLKAYVDVSSATSASEITEKLEVTIRHMDADGNIDYMPISTFASTKIKVNKSHTLIANWAPVSYSITLSAGSHAGSATAVSGVEYGTTVPALPTPSVDTGYTFSGWYTSSSGGTRVSEGDGFSQNAINGTWNHTAHTLTLYSRATPAFYSITLDTNGGSGGSTSIYARYLSSSLYSSTNESSVTTPNAPSRTGYTFEGWYTSSSGGSKVISSAGALQASVSGYTNSSSQWSNAGGKTLYAKWLAKKYAITLNVNGATGGMTSNKTIYAQYASNTLYADGTQGSTTAPSWTNPTRTNYSFAGWSTSSALGSGTIVINTGKALTESNGYTNSSKYWTTDGGATLYACWQPAARTVNVNLRKVGGGSSWDGASYSLNYTKATTTSITVENTSSTATASYAAWQNSVMTFQAAFDKEIFLGVTTTDTAPTVAPHNMGVDTYTVTTTATQNIYLWMQVISTPLRLANDERGWWWYLEDGVFPQSYVGDTLNGTLNSASISCSSYSFGAGQTIDIGTYSGSQYAKVAGNGATIKINGGTTQTFASGTNYWFKVEPIKWRVSKFYTDYNTAIAAYPNISYSNVYGISDMLGYGYMTTGTTAAGTAVSSFAGATLSYSGLGFGDTTTMSIGNEKYSADLSSVKVTWQTRDASQSNTLNVADAYSTISGALKGVTYTKYATSDNIPSAGTFNEKFYASDLSAMKMGMSYNNARAWTTDLYNLGSGYVILSSGSMQTSYFDENYGYIFAHKVATASNCGLEYKAMNYIQSSGTQWIDTGYLSSYNLSVDAVISIDEAKPSSAYRSLFGNISSWVMNFVEDTTGTRWVGQAPDMFITTYTVGKKFSIKATYNSCVIDGNSITRQADSNSVSYGDFYIGRAYRDPVGKMTIYSFKIYDNNTLVRDFVPVQNLKTGAYGLFDKVNKVFYGNAGSGAFTAG